MSNLNITEAAQSSGESSSSRAATQTTNTSQPAQSSTEVETSQAPPVNTELMEFIESVKPNTERLRKRRRDANMAELKKLFSMRAETTDQELRDWLYHNLSVLRHCLCNTVPDPSTYIKHHGHYFEVNVNRPAIRGIMSRILTIVFLTDWKDDQEMKEVILFLRKPARYFDGMLMLKESLRKHRDDYTPFRMYRDLANPEFQEAVKSHHKAELKRRKQHPHSPLRHMELADSDEACNSEEDISNGKWDENICITK